MKNIDTKKKLLLHACCGPCSLEPVRLLSDDGWHITIMYSNSNIYPKSEYDKRLETLIDWAKNNSIDVISDNYNYDQWAQKVEPIGNYKPRTEKRSMRCGACYLHRFAKVAEYASIHGFNNISTTLSVSPYQYTKIIEQKLKQAAKFYGLDYVFCDFSPYYQNAVRRSKEIQMYRQHYCGCKLSFQESIEQKKQAEVQKQKNLIKQKEIQAKAAQNKIAKAQIQAKKERKNLLKKQYKNNLQNN